MDTPYLILGAGFTGRRVAAWLLADRKTVVATSRDPERLTDLRAVGAIVVRLDLDDPESLENLRGRVPEGSRVLHSIPSLKRPDGLEDPTSTLLPILADRPARVVYLSTTGVYGDRREVDESTPVAPVTERQTVRVEAEERVAAGPWSSLILRPAAIYGPGRGVHESMRRGRYRLAGDGSHIVSRIHVDDLARLATAGLRSDLTGSFPVADDGPSAAREVAAFCAERFGYPFPPFADPAAVGETMRTTRRVDGRAIRRALGVELLYPSYRLGIPAAVAAEAEGDQGVR